MSFLPSQVAYTPTLPSLGADVVNTSIALAPTTGSAFSENAIISFDIPTTAGAYLDPESLYLRYKWSTTSALGFEIKGTPAYTPIKNVQVFFGSAIVENTQDWGMVQNMVVNLTHNAAQKAGLAGAYGYSDYTATNMGQGLNGRTGTLNEVFSVAAPFPCILSNAQKLIPLGLMPQIRVSITLDTISNIYTTAVVPTAFSLTNVELCYDSVSMPGVDNQVRGMGEKIYIKSAAYSTATTAVASGSSGSIDLLYNVRLSSIKSVFASFGGTTAQSLNKSWDSYDITSNSGDYAFSVGGIQHPQRPISAVNCRAAALMELKAAIGGVHSSQTNNFSISAAEFAYVGNGTTTMKIPAKFIISQNLERLQSNQILLSGMSSQASPVSLRISSPTATAQLHNVSCIFLYDALIEVDTMSKNAVVKQ